MPSVSFSFKVWNKYWPPDKATDNVLKATVLQILSDAGISSINMTVIVEHLQTPSDGQHVLVSVNKAPAVLSDLDHKAVVERLGLPHP